MTNLTKERLTITVQREVKRDLERLIPQRLRSAFAERALQDALKAEAKRRALEALQNPPKSKQKKNQKKTDSVELVEQIRKQMGDHLQTNNQSKSKP